MPMKTLQAATSKKLTSIFQYPTSLSREQIQCNVVFYATIIWTVDYLYLFDRLGMPVRVSKKIKKG